MSNRCKIEKEIFQSSKISDSKNETRKSQSDTFSQVAVSVSFGTL